METDIIERIRRDFIRMNTREQIIEKVQFECGSISDQACAVALQSRLVEPRCERREWDYGFDGQTFACWIVLEHPPSDTCIVYCNDGFGPACPWGLLALHGPYRNMGPDYQWFSFLEDAFRGSQAWDGENPADYKVR